MKYLAKQYHRDTFHLLLLFHHHWPWPLHAMPFEQDTQSMMVLYGPEGSLRNCRQKVALARFTGGL